MYRAKWPTLVFYILNTLVLATLTKLYLSQYVNEFGLLLPLFDRSKIIQIFHISYLF